MRTNEHDANLSLQPLERAKPGSITYYTPSPKTRPWVDLLRAVVCVGLFALIGVMLGLGA